MVVLSMMKKILTMTVELLSLIALFGFGWFLLVII